MPIKNHTSLPIETRWLTIAQHPDILAVLPPGAILSLPVPSVRMQSLCGFYYTQEGGLQVEFVARFCGGLIQQELFDLRREEYDAPLFPELNGRKLFLRRSPALPDEAYRPFYEALGTLLLLYAGREQPCEAGQAYLEALEKLEPKPLFRIYERLNPAFFAWLYSDTCHEEK